MPTVPLARPLPIAIVIPSFEPGGTERQMSELVQRLDRARWQVHLACFRAEGAWFARTARDVASVGAFPIRSFKSLDAPRQMRAFSRWCRERRVMLVHTSDLYSNTLFLPGAAMARVPVRIGSRREINAGKSAGQIALQRAAYACAHRIVTNAQAGAARLRAEGVSSGRIVVIPNGIDLTRVVPAQPGRPRRRVAMVANLRPEKGHDVLIDAAVHVLARVPDAQFDLIGDGSERARLEQRARERGVAHAFTFAGHCEDVPSRLANADVFVLPSRSEAFPNAVLEAMAAGLPVIASAVGGILEVVEDGHTGLLTAPADVAGLADRICRVLEDDVLAGRVAAAGRARVHERYGFERMVSSIDALYARELTARLPVRVPQSQFASL